MRMTASWFGAQTGLRRIQGCGADRRHSWQARLGQSCVILRPADAAWSWVSIGAGRSKD